MQVGLRHISKGSTPLLTHTLPDIDFLFFRDVIEPPVWSIDRDSKWPAMLFKMLCCKSSDGHDFFDCSNSVPYSEKISAEAYSIVTWHT